MEIRVALDDSYPPYAFRGDDGRIQGLSVDFWKLFEKKTGIRVTLYAEDWADAMARFETGGADVLDTVFYSPQRDDRYDFTPSYARIDVPIFFTRDLTGITGPESLAGFRVALKKGDNAVSMLERLGLTDFREYESYTDIIDAARDGREHLFVMDQPSAMY